ncbi:MAG: hypothetical protein IT367_13820 [Candidatus Hydrogenedentes bacterium]|nr:hypothetical protein [Candidatus Hydrogenedentota bacterium]
MKLNSPRFVLLFAAIVYAAFIFIRLSVHNWDATYFVTAGDVYTDPVSAPKGLYIMRGATGHDGQFYYRFALDPITDRITDYGITLDLPAYRQQRILYPVLVNLLSLGHVSAVPFWMLAINYIGICAIAWVGSKYTQTLGLHAMWGLAFACYPGFVLTLARDFTEILGASLLITTLWLLRTNRAKSGIVFGTLAVLARETTMLASAAVTGVAILAALPPRFLPTALRNVIPRLLPRNLEDTRDRAATGPLYSRAHLLFAIPVFAGVAWQIYLRCNWGHFASADTGTMSLPFVSFFTSLYDKTSFATGQQIAGFLQMLLVAAFAIAAAFALRSSTAAPHEKLAWLLYAALTCIVSGNVWSEDWSFLRNLWELYVFGAIILMTSTSRAKVPFFVCWGCLWLFELILRTDLHKALLDGTP